MQQAVFSTAALKEVKTVPKKAGDMAEPKCKPVTIRMTVADYLELRKRAFSEGDEIGPFALRWILERLKGEDHDKRN